MRETRVLIVDDHPLIAQGMSVALQAEGITVTVSTGPTVTDVLAAADEAQPDVVLLDLQLDGEIGSGVRLIAPLRERGAAVVVLTGVTDPDALAVCFEAGADGLAKKSESFDDLVGKVLRAARRERVNGEAERYELLQGMYSRRAEHRERLAPFARLTQRESAVLADLMDGLQAHAIAERSCVSVSTIRSQIRSIFLKLGVTSQVAAVALARAAGWEPSLEGVR